MFWFKADSIPWNDFIKSLKKKKSENEFKMFLRENM